MEFGLDFGSLTAPEQATTGAEPALYGPDEFGLEPSTITKMSGVSELREIPTLAEIIGNEVEVAEEIVDLQLRQKKYISYLGRHLFIQELPLTGEGIWNNWPVGMNLDGRISAGVKEPEDRGRVFRAGPRPSINQIQAYMRTTDYELAMKEAGISVNLNDHGLTAEQMGFLTILSNPADNRDLKKKLSASGVPWSKFQVWLKQRDFKAAYYRINGDVLKDMIPVAEQQLAAKMASGDIGAIKLGMEITGRHDPAGKKQVDAEHLIAIILEVMEEEIKDQSVLQRIASKISLRGVKALE